MDFETTFRQNHKTLLELSKTHSFRCRGTISVDEFYSGGCKVFMSCFDRYDPQKAQFNTYFITSCKLFFKRIIATKIRREINQVSEEVENCLNELDPERKVTFLNTLSKLTDDAIEIVTLVLKTSSDISKSKIRSFFIKKWGGYGAQERVRFAFNEISKTLNEI